MANVKALDSYKGYNVTRNASTVSFGCGEVKVSKKDLLAAAELVESKEFKAGLKLLRKLEEQASGNMDIEEIVEIPGKTFRALAG